jgi:hypothetical protein
MDISLKKKQLRVELLPETDKITRLIPSEYSSVDPESTSEDSYSP